MKKVIKLTAVFAIALSVFAGSHFVEKPSKSAGVTVMTFSDPGTPGS